MLDRIHTLDLHFLDRPQTIAAYLIPHDAGGVLIETGPGSTTDMLVARLAEHDLTPADITDVLLTHIHLDHAGAAGWMARHGATIHVHRIGVRHMVNPSRLLKSAERIYGDEMDRLWGDFLPVPEAQIVALNDGDRITVGDLTFEALDTPGHASHHMAYVIDGICFSGDVGGVRIPGEQHVQLPLAPPEIHFDHWRDSLATLRRADIAHIAPTHFGVYEDAADHLDRLEDAIETADAWVDTVMRDAPSEDALREHVTTWMRERAAADGVSDDAWERYEAANPSWMAAAGLKRYWSKHKATAAE